MTFLKTIIALQVLLCVAVVIGKSDYSLVWVFNHLWLCVATAIHNHKWLKVLIIYKYLCLNSHFFHTKNLQSANKTDYKRLMLRLADKGLDPNPGATELSANCFDSFED